MKQLVSIFLCILSLATFSGTGLVATYFASPRPVYELYDLDNDPSELKNLSGKREMVGVERELREALAEKMILDCDYLPLPALLNEQGKSAGGKSAGGKKRQVKQRK